MKNKTVLITGGSQGIGLAIGLRYAKEAANIVILSKDSVSNIVEATDQIKKIGGDVLALDVDVSDFEQLKLAVEKTVTRFGGIDVLVNNTSATRFTDTLHTTPEHFDLMLSTSVRAAYFLSQACYPYLKKASNPHIINISPPLNLDTRWFKEHLAFTIAKYSMSMCTIGLSAEFLSANIAVNSLWPQTTIATQTIKNHFLPQVYLGSRWPSIMGDAAYELTQKSAQDWTGQFFTDELLLRKTGVTDFTHYAVDPQVPLVQPLFIPLGEGMIPISADLFL